MSRLECPECRREMKYLRELEDHLREVHGWDDDDLESYGFDEGLYLSQFPSSSETKEVSP